MCNVNADTTVINCVFTGNMSVNGGSGMFNETSSPTVTNCAFIGNTANQGGGMSTIFGDPIITNCFSTGTVPQSMAVVCLALQEIRSCSTARSVRIRP